MKNYLLKKIQFGFKFGNKWEKVIEKSSLTELNVVNGRISFPGKGEWVSSKERCCAAQ